MYIIWLTVFIGLVASALYLVRKHPINDITTDTDAPVEFATLVAVGSHDKRFSKVQKRCYDVRPLKFPLHLNDENNQVRGTHAHVIEIVRTIMITRGWQVVHVDENKCQAVATTPLMRFRDDVVVEVRPSQDERFCEIHARSKSRTGKSDLGTNAYRIRSLLADIAAQSKFSTS
jgi:uncharacterized protein (DUF1499 family)